MLYTYNGMNQVIREEDAVRGTTYTYTYDLGGNLLENKKYDRVNGVEELRGTDTYTYSSGWKDQLTSFNGKAITYRVDLGKGTAVKDSEEERNTQPVHL